MNRFHLNPKKIFDEKARIAYTEAARVLQTGTFCSDCLELHERRPAVSFVVHESPQPNEFFVSFLCEKHADMFMAKNRGVTINGRKWN